MNFKPFDRFFIFVLALATALYFFGSKSSSESTSDKAATSVSMRLHFERIHDGNAVPPVGVETKEEQASEDDEPADDDEFPGDDNDDKADDDYTSRIFSGHCCTSSQHAYHCPLYIRLRSILI